MRLTSKIVAVLAAGAILSGVTVAPAARADTDWPFSGPKGDRDANAYWVDISSVADGSVASAGNLANTICDVLRRGHSEGEVIAAGANGDQSKIPKARLIVHAAEWHFCPSYY